MSAEDLCGVRAESAGGDMKGVREETGAGAWAAILCDERKNNMAWHGIG